MLTEYKRGDILSIPVAENKVAPAQIIEKLGSNVLIAIFAELLDAGASCDVASLELDHPIFIAETMDLRIKDGVWRKIGHRGISDSIPVPEYKVWVEPPGEYRIQDIRGNVGMSISATRANGMKSQESFSPAVIEAALRGFHEYGPWHKAFDELTV